MYKKFAENISEELKKLIEANVEIKETTEVYKMVISKEVTDRDGDIVVLSGIDKAPYMKNPVVLIDHDYRVEKIVGKTKSLRVENNELVATFVFADTENGRLSKSLYDAGFLKTSSIGFMIKERDPNDRCRITKWELLEWSLVAVPSNREALSQDFKSLYEEGVAKGIIKDCPAEEPEDKPTETPTDLDEVKTLLKEIKAGIEEVKTYAKTLADSKAMDNAEEEAKAKRKLLQSINQATSQALAGLKQL